MDGAACRPITVLTATGMPGDGIPGMDRGGITHTIHGRGDGVHHGVGAHRGHGHGDGEARDGAIVRDVLFRLYHRELIVQPTRGATWLTQQGDIAETQPVHVRQ